jgi:hypothetical protein
MTFSPRLASARAAFAAVAGALWLSASSLPLGAEAAVTAQQPAKQLITQVTTTHGETIRFSLLPDGSIGVDGNLPVSAAATSVHANRRQFATPLQLFAAAAPNQQAPAALLAANARYVSTLRAGASLKVAPSFKTEQAPRVRQITPQQTSENWWITNYCNPASGSSYNVCYTDAWNWAYLSASSVYYGHSVVWANTGPLLFTVNPVGQWTVPQGWVWWADEYHYSPFGWNNFAFYAGVSNARYFDFEADVDY